MSQEAERLRLFAYTPTFRDNTPLLFSTGALP
jgi:hypothetical protein